MEELVAILQYPLWVQFLGLSPYLGNIETCIRIMRKISKVLKVELSNTYASKTIGPRIKLLIRHIKNLPQKVIIQGDNTKKNLENKLLFNGLPSQCNHRCALEHLNKASKMKKQIKTKKNSP